MREPERRALPATAERVEILRHGSGGFAPRMLEGEAGAIGIVGLASVTSRLTALGVRIECTLWIRREGGFAVSVGVLAAGSAAMRIAREVGTPEAAMDVLEQARPAPCPSPRIARAAAPELSAEAGGAVRAAVVLDAWQRFVGETLAAWAETTAFTVR